MADNDPRDDVRMVVMTTAAAAAPVVEIAAREAKKRREPQQPQKPQQPLQRPRWNADRREAIQQSRPDLGNDAAAPRDATRDQLRQAMEWASPARREDYRRQRDAAETAEGQQSVNRALICEWRKALQPEAP